MRRTPLENWIINRTGIVEGSRKALEHYQLERVKEAIAYCRRNSSFYSETLKEFNADEIKSLEDLRKLPFTYPEDISKNPYSFLCVPQREIKRIVTLNTSGTSGSSKRIFFTEGDLAYTIDFFMYGMSCLTDESDRVLVLLPGRAYGSIGDLLNKALERSNIAVGVMGVLTDLESAVRYIEAFRPTCIVGIPVQVLYLSRRKGEIFRRYIKKILLSTDYVPEVLIRELTEKQGCSVYTHYGMTEMGYGGGVECQALNGYHMREGDLYVEIIDPITGGPVGYGETGEVVFTTLTREAMPLIRYRTGDFAAFSKEQCGCGSFLKTVKRVRGRINNRLRLEEGHYLYLGELDELLFSFEAIMNYSAYMEPKNRLVVSLYIPEEEKYRQVKADLEQGVGKFLKVTHGVDLEIRLDRESNPSNISNSMIKRTIKDYRK